MMMMEIIVKNFQFFLSNLQNSFASWFYSNSIVGCELWIRDWRMKWDDPVFSIRNVRWRSRNSPVLDPGELICNKFDLFFPQVGWVEDWSDSLDWIVPGLMIFSTTMVSVWDQILCYRGLPSNFTSKNHQLLAINSIKTKKKNVRNLFTHQTSSIVFYWD